MNKVSGVPPLIMLVVGLGLNISNILSLTGTVGIGAIVLLILGSLVIGLLAGRDCRFAADPAPNCALVGQPQRGRGVK